MTKKRICAILAGILVLAMSVGAVWAWYDNSQHKSNIATGGPDNIAQDVVLVEDFKEPDDWMEGDLLDKKISVLNKGEGDIFVRIQLKEYMETAAQHYSYTDEYLLVDSNGAFVSAASKADLKAWIAQNMPDLVYTDSQLVGPFTAYGVTGAGQFYLAVDETTNYNGKYGKQLLTSFVQDGYKSFDSAVERGEYENTADHRDHPTSECLYTIHTWDGEDHCDCENADQGKFHDFVQWNLGSDIILLSDWVAAGSTPGAFWILDDTSDEGWAYWGQALAPNVETSKLMESIELIKQPDGPFYYALHVDMQASDIYQVKSKFTGMPVEIENLYRPITGLHITADKTTVGQNGTVQLEAYFDGAPVTASWSFVRKDGQSNVSHPNTQINAATGELKIGPQQAVPVTLIVTATYTPAGGTVQTKTLEIEVE